MLKAKFRAVISSILIVSFAFLTSACSSGGDGSDAGAGASTIANGVAELSWVAPAEREDNTPISLSEIDGYRIYYGNEEGSYENVIDVGNNWEHTVNGLSAGTYYFVVTTVDIDGRESAYSTEVSITI